MNQMNRAPKYPFYIVSKGRHMYMTSSKALTKMGINHNIVVEPSEVELYQKAIDENNLLAQETLFLDDTQMHLDGAAKLGIQTQQVSNKNTIHDILKFF